MEPLQETYTVRTRDGQEYAGLTLSSLRIAAAQKIFSMEDVVRPDKMAGTWTPLARVLSLPDPGTSRTSSGAQAQRRDADRPTVSTGIALDLDARPERPRVASVPPPAIRPEGVGFEAPASADPGEEEGSVRHRLRIAGAFLLFFGILGMLAYALGRHGAADAVVMLVNTGFGIALLMNLTRVRPWAAGWVLAGWALSCLGATLAGGCIGLVIVGLGTGIGFGGPACLLWGEDCPKGRFWAGIALMGTVVLLMTLGAVLAAVAGATLFQRMHG